MSITRTLFGEVDGQPIERYCMRNRSGTSAAVLTLGANLHSVRTRGREGFDEITLAYDDVAGYLAPDSPYFGATAGRVANRIAGGAFSLDGTRYRLACNHGAVHLHGGEVGFDRRIWQAAAHEGDGEDSVVLRYVSPHGEEGYPGTLTAEVSYRLSDNDELSIDLSAATDAPTIVNLTNHTYWNLAGAGSGSIEKHELQLHCAQVLEKDADALPTGAILPVRGTPFDFTSPRRIGERIDEAGGYDHCLVIDGAPGTLRTFALPALPRFGKGDGGGHHAARRATVQCRVPDPHRRRRRPHLRPARRPVPGNAALPRQRAPPPLPLHRPAARRNLPPPHRAPLPHHRVAARGGTQRRTENAPGGGAGCLPADLKFRVT